MLPFESGMNARLRHEELLRQAAHRHPPHPSPTRSAGWTLLTSKGRHVARHAAGWALIRLGLRFVDPRHAVRQ